MKMKTCSDAEPRAARSSRRERRRALDVTGTLAAAGVWSLAAAGVWSLAAGLPEASAQEPVPPAAQEEGAVSSPQEEPTGVSEEPPATPRGPEDLERFREDARWFHERALEGMTREEREAFEAMSPEEKHDFLHERASRLLEEAIRIREEHLSRDLPPEAREHLRGLPRDERWREFRGRMRARMEHKTRRQLERAFREGWLTEEEFEELRRAPLDLRIEALMDLRAEVPRDRNRQNRGRMPPMPPPPPGRPPEGVRPFRGPGLGPGGPRAGRRGPLELEHLRERHRIRSWRRRMRDRGPWDRPGPGERRERPRHEGSPSRGF